ncbi:signal peptidase I [Paenibacillus ginsengarvi]|uniref:Signal peptidase I n=1 Tax=Paenibacillus ginsengarvi TaxID=400777 RepID=A0A3B0AY29_9BACL|nr:signal peptidase I [Paenibacillus ginsengarvi]RKN64887.1 signal peptidase I [Paenibacillus ginsengarvi]
MKIGREIWSWVRSIGIAFVFSLLIGVFVFQPFKVEGHSMDPTLHDRQRMYVSKLSHTLSYLPSYGDIVVIDSRVGRARSVVDDLLDNPLVSLFSGDQGRIFYVKRVIGKPGDLIEIKDGQLYRNGEQLNEPYIKEEMNMTAARGWNVPDGHLFVMGDNRNNSRDSRDIGFVPLDHVLGEKLF